jgi:hypothetical protein
MSRHTGPSRRRGDGSRFRGRHLPIMRQGSGRIVNTRSEASASAFDESLRKDMKLPARGRVVNEWGVPGSGPDADALSC